MKNTIPLTPEETALLSSLRAASWNEFVGQDSLKTALQISLSAAKKRKEALDHALFYGPPGLGKTTLAHLIAHELGVHIHTTSGTALSKVGDLAAILTNLESHDVLFIDEIHRLPKSVEETLYPAMEDYALDIVIGKGPSARTIRLDLQHFTLVGATTRLGLLTGPFRDRFGVVHKLAFYSPKALAEILTKAAKKLQIIIDPASCERIAERSRGTPRIALKLLKRVRDYAQVKGNGSIELETVEKALHLIHIDPLGLDESDLQYLQTLVYKYRGGPVGLSTLATSLHEDSGTIEEVVEPFLIQLGFLKRTTQGRVITELGKKHIVPKN